MCRYIVAMTVICALVSRLPKASAFQAATTGLQSAGTSGRGTLRSDTALFVQNRGLEVRREGATPTGTDFI